MHTYFVLSVYTVQCVVRDRCVYGDNVTDLEDIRRSPEPWKSKDGDCFMPFEEVCRLTWATVAVWAMLLMCTVILLAKEVSRNQFLYKKKPTRIPVYTFVLSFQIFQLMHSQKQYFQNWENWVQLCIIVNVILIR